MQWVKAIVALVLAFVWLPAASCCLIDASGLLDKRDCCAKQHSQTTPSPGHCDQPCSLLASASYFPPQSQVLVMAPAGWMLFDRGGEVPPLAHTAPRVHRSFPATAPPDWAGRWQFAFRTALPSRAPSLAS